MTGAFRVLDAAAAEEVQAQVKAICPDDAAAADPTSLLLLAALYAEYELWDDAIRVHARLVKEFPDDQEAAQRLASLRAAQGQTAGD
jgi:hypothetical protein